MARLGEQLEGEVRAVVHAQMGSGALGGGDGLDGGDDAVGIDAVIEGDRQGFAGVLVDDVEQLES